MTAFDDAERRMRTGTAEAFGRTYATFVLPEPAGLSLDQITRSPAEEPARTAVLPDTALAS